MFPLLLNVETFHDHLASLSDSEIEQSLRIIDLGSIERFASDHLAQARLVTPSQTQFPEPPKGRLPSVEALEQLFARLDIQEHHHIVVYDDEGSGWAGRFIWILDECGFDKYSVLDGGILAWKAAGYATEQGEVDFTSIPSFEPRGIAPSHRFSASHETIEAGLAEQIHHIWDARGPQEYTGEKVNAARGGHIPGAINFNWTDAMDKDKHLILRPLDELKSELATLGIDGSKPIITHCQTHHRSGLTYLIAKLLGYSVQAYPGSWSEWGNLEHAPIVAGDQPNA